MTSTMPRLTMINARIRLGLTASPRINTPLKITPNAGHEQRCHIPRRQFDKGHIAAPDQSDDQHSGNCLPLELGPVHERILFQGRITPIAKPILAF